MYKLKYYFGDVFIDSALSSEWVLHLFLSTCLSALQFLLHFLSADVKTALCFHSAISWMMGFWAILCFQLGSILFVSAIRVHLTFYRCICISVSDNHLSVPIDDISWYWNVLNENWCIVIGCFHLLFLNTLFTILAQECFGWFACSQLVSCVCRCCTFLCIMSLWVSCLLWLPLTSQKPASRCNVYCKLFLVVNVCCVHDALCHKLYSCLMPSIPWIDSGFSMTLTRITLKINTEAYMKMNKWIFSCVYEYKVSLYL